MKKFLFALGAIIVFATSCGKSDTPSPTVPESDLNLEKFVNKDWFEGGKHYPQMLTVRYNSTDTVIQTQCVWILEPYKFSTSNFLWKKAGTDSISVTYLDGSPGTTFRVFSVDDTMLVTSNWVYGGPGISDTGKVVFKTL